MGGCNCRWSRASDQAAWTAVGEQAAFRFLSGRARGGRHQFGRGSRQRVTTSRWWVWQWGCGGGGRQEQQSSGVNKWWMWVEARRGEGAGWPRTVEATSNVVGLGRRKRVNDGE